jgi:uncharacterized hydantoinase/oxoprolinase family protein
MWLKKKNLCVLCAYVVKRRNNYVPMWLKKKNLCALCSYVVKKRKYYVSYVPMWLKNPICQLFHRIGKSKKTVKNPIQAE